MKNGIFQRNACGVGRRKVGHGAQAEVAHRRANNAGDAGEGRAAGRRPATQRRGDGASDRRWRQPPLSQRQRVAALRVRRRRAGSSGALQLGAAPWRHAHRGAADHVVAAAATPHHPLLALPAAAANGAAVPPLHRGLVLRRRVPRRRAQRPPQVGVRLSADADAIRRLHHLPPRTPNRHSRRSCFSQGEVSFKCVQRNLLFV